jgi:hypothetical protein
MASPLIRLTEFPKAFPETGLTVPALRWQVFNEAHNGLRDSGAIARVGRAVYVDPDRYFAWMRSNPRSAPRARTEAA